MKVPGLGAVSALPARIAEGVGTMAGAAGNLATTVVMVPAEALELVGRIEVVLTRVEALLDTAEERLVAVEDVTEQARTVVVEARAVSDGAASTMAEVSAQILRAEQMLATAEPELSSLAPVAEEIARLSRPEHVASIVTVLDQLPEISTRIVPAVDNLVQLIPELDLLLDRLDDVAKIVQGMPGARLFQRRTEENDRLGGR